MQVQPANIEIVELANELAWMLASGNIDVARVRQIEVRAARLGDQSQSSRKTAYMALFMVKYALGDRVGVEKWVADALLQGGHSDKTVLMNAISVLGSIGNLGEAQDLIQQLVEMAPGDLKVLEAAIVHSGQSLFLAKAVDFYAKYAKLASDLRDPLPLHLQRKIESCKTALLRMSESDLVSRLGMAIATIRQSGYEVLRQGRTNLPDGEFVSYLYVNVDMLHCAQLNFAIADALVEEYEDVGADLFSIVCRPFENYTTANDQVVSL